MSIQVRIDYKNWDANDGSHYLRFADDEVDVAVRAAEDYCRNGFWEGDYFVAPGAIFGAELIRLNSNGSRSYQRVVP